MVSVYSIRPWLSTIQIIHFQYDLKTMIQYMWEHEKKPAHHSQQKIPASVWGLGRFPNTTTVFI